MYEKPSPRLVFLVGFDEPGGIDVARSIIASLSALRFKWWPIDEPIVDETTVMAFDHSIEKLVSLVWPSDVSRPTPMAVESELRSADQDFLIALMMFERFRGRHADGVVRIDSLVTHTARVLAYWTSLIAVEEPRAAVFSRIPHNFADYLFFVALKRQGVPVLVGRTVQIGPSLSIVDATLQTKFEVSKNSDEKDVRRDLEQDVQFRRRRMHPSYMSVVKYPLDVKGSLAGLKLERRFSSDWSQRNTVVFQYLLGVGTRRLENRRARKMLVSIVERDRVDVERTVQGRRYVYLPLHLQPEATTSPLAGVLCDQRLFVEAIASAAARHDLDVLLKENPKQVPHLRGRDFWRDVAAMPGVHVVAQSVNSFELISSATLVATLNGTAGWEAACVGCPVVAHESSVYSGAPGVFVFSTLEELVKVFDSCITYSQRSNHSPDVSLELRGFLSAIQAESLSGSGLNTVRSTSAASKAPDRDHIEAIASYFTERISLILSQVKGEPSG